MGYNSEDHGELEDDGIDQETVDLFAVMNSSILELQIEMERLESKDYDEDATSFETTGSSLHGKPSLMSCEEDVESTVHDVFNGEKETVLGASNVHWDRIEPAKEGDADYAPVVVPSSSIRWDKLLPAKQGDADYVPVCDFSIPESKNEANPSSKPRRSKRERIASSNRTEELDMKG